MVKDASRHFLRDVPVDLPGAKGVDTGAGLSGPGDHERRLLGRWMRLGCNTYVATEQAGLGSHGQAPLALV